MVYQLIFSPTGGTQAVANALSGGQVVDLTDRNFDFSSVALTAEDVAFIAVPSYGGRVPLPAVEIGDVLRFENAGAYCMTEGSALFLSRELPGIYLRHGEGLLQCVRSPQETYPLNMPQL